MTSTYSQEDIRLLRLDAIAESLSMVSTFAGHGVDHANFGDEAGLQASLFRTVKTLNAALDTWRELRPGASGPPASDKGVVETSPSVASRAA